MGSNGEHDKWIGPALRHTAPVTPDGCPDTETLAAWVDGGMGAKAASDVELHASSCSRCMAVLAAMERSAPAAAAEHAWTPMRVFRWVAPLTAAAAAVIIWIVVPDRPITPVEPARGRESVTLDAGTMDRQVNPEPGTQNPNQNPEPSASNPNPAPSTQNPEPQKQEQVQQRADEKQLAVRDEFRRERAAPETFSAPAAAPSADAALGAPAAERSNAVAETAVTTATARRSALGRLTATTESVSPSNTQMRWRIIEPAVVERSTDGGGTWTRTTSPAPSIADIRAVDSARAVVRSSDGTEFYTTNGGVSWTRVQEKSAAPF